VLLLVASLPKECKSEFNDILYTTIAANIRPREDFSVLVSLEDSEVPVDFNLKLTGSYSG